MRHDLRLVFADAAEVMGVWIKVEDRHGNFTSQALAAIVRE